MFIIIYMLLVILCQSLIFTEGLSTINGIDELVQKNAIRGFGVTPILH